MNTIDFLLQMKNSIDFFNGVDYFERKQVVNFILDNYGQNKHLIHSKTSKRGSNYIRMNCSLQGCGFKIFCSRSRTKYNNQHFLFDSQSSNLHHGITNANNVIVGLCSSSKKVTTVT